MGSLVHHRIDARLNVQRTLNIGVGPNFHPVGHNRSVTRHRAVDVGITAKNIQLGARAIERERIARNGDGVGARLSEVRVLRSNGHVLGDLGVHNVDNATGSTNATLNLAIGNDHRLASAHEIVLDRFAVQASLLAKPHVVVAHERQTRIDCDGIG